MRTNNVRLGLVTSVSRAHARRMHSEPIVFSHTGLTVRAALQGEAWQGQIVDARGEVQDEFSYTREAFPGAVIGALRFRDLDFTVRLAARLWLYTDGSGGAGGLVVEERAD